MSATISPKPTSTHRDMDDKAKPTSHLDMG